MKKSLKIIIVIFAVSIFSSPFSVLRSQDAEYNLIRRTYKVNNDGTMDFNIRKEIKLLRNRAITAYADKGETFILYNPAIDKLTINESYTIRKDGSRVQTPPNAFVDQLPSQCTDCGRYNGIREMAVIHTALEYDCIIVLDYTIHRQGRRLDEQIILAEDCPVKKYEVIFDAPDDNYDINICNGMDPRMKTIKKLKDGHIFHCIITDIPQTYNDSYLPKEEDLYPVVILKYAPASPSFVCGTGGKNFDLPKNNHTISNLLAELQNNNSLTYVTNIRDYVFDNIHTSNFPLSLVNYEISSASETFFSACGTPADKEWLTLALIREAGFKADKKDGLIVVTVNENGREMDYTLSTTDKRPLRLSGAAIDEQRTISVVDTLPWSGTNKGDGYKQMQLPVKRGAIAIDAAQLTSVREAPVKVRNCNENYHYTILLPRTPKHLLVGEPVDINYSKKGIGSVSISIKQLPGGAIDVVRQLSIDVENGIVTSKQYKEFRKIMQLWNQYTTITIKAEKGRPIN